MAFKNIGTTVPQDIGVTAQVGGSGKEADSQHVHKTVLSTGGDLLVMNGGSGSLSRLAVGSPGYGLVPNPNVANGLQWMGTRSCRLRDLSQTTVITNSNVLTVIYGASNVGLDGFFPGILAAGSNAVRLCVYGTIVASTTAATIVISARVNATAIVADTTVSLTASASKRAFKIEVIFFCRSGTNVFCVGDVEIGAVDAHTTGVALDFGTAAPALKQPFIGTSASVSPITGAQQFDVTFTMSTTTNSVVREYGEIELLTN